MRRPTRHDLGWALLVGTVLGLSPHTSGHRLVPSIVLGSAAGAGVLAYRLLRRPRGEPAPRRSLRPPLLFWACLFALCIVFAPTAAWLYEEWTRGIWHDAHGLFVPFIIAYLAQRVLRRDTRPDAEASPWGFCFVLASLGLVVFDAALRTQYLSVIGLVLCLPGLSLLLLGVRRTRALAAPLALGVLLVPISSTFASDLYLTNAVAGGMQPLLEQTGVPVLRNEAVFVLPKGVFRVSENCSGFSTFHAAVGTSLFLALYTRSNIRRATLLLAPWPFTAIANILRGVVLLILCQVYGIEFLNTPFHGLSGIAAFWMVLVPILLMGDWRRLREAFA